MKKISALQVCICMLLLVPYSFAQSGFTSVGVTIAGGNGTGAAIYQVDPHRVALDAFGDLFILDGYNSRIFKTAPGASRGIISTGGNGAQAGVFATDAAGKTVARGNDGDSGAIHLASPVAVSAGNGGKIFVAEAGNSRVQRFDVPQSPGSPALGVTVAGGDGSISASGVHVDRNGNVYVADEAHHRIQKYVPGSLTSITVAGGNGAGSAANQLNTPKAVFVDTAGTIYIADAANNRVQKWAPGALSGITVAGGNGAGNAANQLGYPNDIFVDKDGNVFVSEYNNDRITEWVPGFTFGGNAALRGAPGIHPTGLTGDANGYLYVSVSEYAAVLQWINNNFISAVAGKFTSTPTVGSGAGELNAPAGVFVDASRTVFVADQGNHRIQKWVQGATTGVTVAGGNGPGTGPTQLLSPNDVFVDASGNIYVATGDRVQKFTTNGTGAGINYKYYEGNFNALPDFNALTPVKTGISANISLASREQGRNDNYAFLWEGKIKIPAAGSYIFETVSDDGSRLYFNRPYSFNAIPTVNNDGVHAVTSATGTVSIDTPGTYPIAISFFEKDGGENMQVFWSGPGIARQQIPDSVFESSSVENTAPTIPQVFHIVSKGVSYVNLVWVASTDNVGVTGYDVYIDGVKKYTTTESHLTADGLLPNTTYTFSVKAFDLAGNSSGSSSQITVTTNAITGGLSYKFYEGIWSGLPDFATLDPNTTGSTPNVDISVRKPGVNNNFAFVWEGYINIQTPGNYTFETVSDDGSKLYFNSFAGTTAIATVSNDGLHAPTSATGTIYIASAGSYPITISYFEKDGGESMQVYWTGPGIPRQLIPDEAFTPGATPLQSGLNYKYYEGDWNTLPNFNTLAPVKTGSTPSVDISVRPAGKNDHFGFLWEGNINIPAPGYYTFETVSDDGSQLFFNSLYAPTALPLVNNDGLHAPASASGTIYIPLAGTYPIAITFFEKDGGESMQVYWSGPGFSRQLIPNAAFTHFTSLLTTAPDLTGVSLRQGNTGEVENKVTTQIHKVYPDPFTDRFKIDFYNSSPDNDISVVILDVNGRSVYKHRAGRLSAGNNSIPVLLGTLRLTNGIYFVTLQVNGIASKTISILKTNR